MKKLVTFAVMLFGIVSLSKAEEQHPQFRLWKSSFIGAGDFTNQKISSFTIIFHVVAGSPTYGTGGDSYFGLYQSSIEAYTNIGATRGYTSLAKDSWLKEPWDVRVGSHAYFTKRGLANVWYEWDFYQVPPYTLPAIVKQQ